MINTQCKQTYLINIGSILIPEYFRPPSKREKLDYHLSIAKNTKLKLMAICVQLYIGNLMFPMCHG